MAVDQAERQRRREKQKQIEKDIRRIKEKQKEEALKKYAPKPKKYVPPPVVWTGTEKQWRKRTGQTTSKQRAEEAAEQIQLRKALPVATATIPSTQKIKIVKKPSRTIRKVVAAPPVSAGFERRIEELQASEARLEEGKEFVYRKLKIERKPTDPYILGVGKTLAQLPFELGSMPVIYGGRAAFAAEAVTSPVGREELGRALRATPKAVAQSYDIRKPEGLVNIGLTVLAVRSIGKARQAARARTTFVTEEAVTKRISTKDFTIDETYLDVEAMVGKKKISLKGRGTQTYQKIGKDTYGIKGTGELTQLPSKRITKIETRGLGAKVKGGYDVTSISKIKTGAKSKMTLDITQSAELIREPTQVFKTISKTAEIPKGKTILDVKPERVGAGVTGEIYIEDIMAGKGRSMFRKTVKGELGTPIAVEQYLASDKFSIDTKTFATEFEGIGRGKDLSRTLAERKAFDIAYQPSGKTVLIKEIGFKAVPTQELALKTIARDQVSIAATKIKGQQVSKAITQGSAGLAARTVNIGALKDVTKTQPFDIVYATPSKPLFKAEPVYGKTIGEVVAAPRRPIVKVAAKPITRPVQQFRIESIMKAKPEIALKPAVRTQLMFDVKPLIRTKPKVALQSALDVRPAVRQRPIYELPRMGFAQEFAPPSQIPPMFPPFAAKGLSFPDSPVITRPSKGKAKLLELPSVEALIFDIKSKKYPKLAALTGLGTRPIKL